MVKNHICITFRKNATALLYAKCFVTKMKYVKKNRQMTAYLDDAGRGRTAISHTFRDARQNQTDANKDRGRRKKMVAVMFCAYARYRPRTDGAQAAALYFAVFLN